MKRSETDSRFKWRLEDIFETNEAWEKEFSELEARIPSISLIKEHLTDDAQSMKKGLDEIYDIYFHMERIFTYAKMRQDEDGSVSLYQGMTQRAGSLMVKVSSALAFLEPMLLKLDDDRMKTFIEAPELKEYSFELRNILRKKQHVLSEESEKLLSEADEIARGSREIFGMLDNVDISFRPFKHEGKDIELSHAKYMSLLQDQDRELRKKAFENYYGYFRDHINTLAATYLSSVRSDIFFAKARNYASALENALFQDNVSTEVYDSLLRKIHENMGLLHDYVALRKKILGVDELHMYDIYVPLVRDFNNSYTFEDAEKMILEALKVLGEDYTDTARHAFTDGWMDVYENDGKRSGAYSWGVYGTHPFMLLNTREDLGSVFTIAHELGHSMHTYYSNSNQPYPTAGYTIFVAEVASTVNEILLTKYLMRTVKDPALKVYVLNHYIDQFRTTVFRQTQFAEFEKIVHEEIEKGNAMTAEGLCSLYGKINADYYGPSMEEDDTIALEWARIPHFYSAFYVYKYAVGFSCASAIVRKLETDPAMKDRYRRFLSAGGSDYPENILRDAGIEVGEAVELCMQEFGAALEEYKKICEG